MLFSRDAPAKLRLWYGIGLIAFTVALASGLDLWRRPFGYDLATYVLAAQRLQDGRPLYPAVVVLGPFGQYFYPPTVALAFVPFTAAPFVGAAIWMMVLVSVAVALGATLVRRHPTWQRPWVAAAIALFPPLVWDLTLGNVTLLAAALALFAHSRRKPIVAGAILAVSLTLKPLTIGLLLFWALAGRGRAAIWTVAIGTASVIVTWPWLGARWIEYAGTVPALAGAAPGSGSNILPTGLSVGSAHAVVVVAAVAIVGVAAAATRRSPDASTHAAQTSLAAGPLLFTTIWYPYLIFAMPLLVEPGSWASPVWKGAAGRVGRVVAWILILAQFGRILPFLGLVLLLTVAAIPLVSALTRRREAHVTVARPAFWPSRDPAP